MRFLFILIVILSGFRAEAQIQFELAPDEWMPSLYSGSVMACVDVDRDGLEDLVLMDRGVHLKVFYQRGDGRGFLYRDLGVQTTKSKWSMVAGDVDQNGYTDIFMMGAYDDIQWVELRDDQVKRRVISAPELYAQGANLVDIDLDGTLELFVCNDIAESYIYEYEGGSGDMVRSGGWLDMRTVTPSDNSGNYGSIWTDLDRNGMPDLYLAKCKAGVTDPADPRRVNALFMQEEELEFRELADSFGLADGSQSWTADFADIDNDGDLDCFIANHKGPSLMMMQEAPGRFVDRTAEWGLDVRFNIIQVKFADMNNDGHLDLILSGAEKRLFLNRDGYFEEQPDFLGESPFTSFVIGDWNGDGWLDLYASYCDLINIPSTRPDRLWINRGAVGGHFIRIQLSGTLSNTDGIGAWVEVHSRSDHQVRELRAGESYGVQNSGILHFGFPEGDVIDSVIIYWPSGLVERFDSWAVDQMYHVIEGRCHYIPEKIHSSTSGYFCSGDSLMLVAPGPGNAHIWSHGPEKDTVFVKQAGKYWVISRDSSCQRKSIPLYVRDTPDQDPDIKSSHGITACVGDEVWLESSEGIRYIWNTGDTTRRISVLESGQYQVSITGFCRDTVSDIRPLNFIPVPDPPVVYHDSLAMPGRARLRAEGGKILWYDQPFGGQLLGNLPWLNLDDVQKDSVVYAATTEDRPGNMIRGGEPEHKGSKLSANSLNGGILFLVEKRCELYSVKVQTEVAGDRLFEVRRSSGEVLAAIRTYLDPGIHELVLGLELLPSDQPYVLTTNTDVNQSEFGHPSPLLYRSDQDVVFPYSLGSEITLTRSIHGTRYYYYFYDWTVRPIESCESERVPVYARILTNISESRIPFSSANIFPNPSQGQLNITFDKGLYDDLRIEILDLNGRILKDQLFFGGEKGLQWLTGLPPGLYLVRLVDGVRVRTFKWIVEP